MTEVALALNTPIGRAKCIAEMSSYEMAIWKVRKRLAPLNCTTEEQARYLAEAIKDGKGPMEREALERDPDNSPTVKQIADKLGWKTIPISELE